MRRVAYIVHTVYSNRHTNCYWLTPIVLRIKIFSTKLNWFRQCHFPPISQLIKNYWRIISWQFVNPVYCFKSELSGTWYTIHESTTLQVNENVVQNITRALNASKMQIRHRCFKSCYWYRVYALVLVFFNWALTICFRMAKSGINHHNHNT